MENNKGLLAFLAASSSLKLIGSYLTRNNRPANLEHVGDLSGLVLYPGKSMQGLELDEGICLSSGLKHPKSAVHDRCLMLVKGNKYISAKNENYARLLSIRTELKGDSEIILHGDYMEPLVLSLLRQESLPVLTIDIMGESVEGQDCGDDAAEWIQHYLNKPRIRLVMGVNSLQKRRVQDRDTKWSVLSKPEDVVVFQNYYPFLLHTESSLNEYNGKIDGSLQMARFRPNFVVSGCKPYDEDNWAEIWIGNVKFSNLKPCQRCNVTTLDPKSGEKEEQNEPLRSLRKYRNISPDYVNSPIFGALLVLDREMGRVRVGDEVYVRRKTEKDATYWRQLTDEADHE